MSESYWLEVCEGREAAMAYVAASGEGVIAALERYPILMLPMFPAAMASMGVAAETPELKATFAENARALRAAQQTLRESFANAYANLTNELALMLADEPRGDLRANLEQAVEAFHSAGTVFGTGRQYAAALFDEGAARWRLAELGANSPANMERAATLFAKAHSAFGEGPDAGECARNEAKVRTLIAEAGIDAIANFTAADQLYMSAYKHYERGDPRGTSCIVGAAHARTCLSELRGSETGGA